MSSAKKYKIIEYFCIFIIILSFALPAFTYSFLPEKIPTHYGADGHADSFAGKANIWFLAIISLITLLGFNKFVKLIQKEVKHKISKMLLIKSLTLLKLAILLLFLFLNTYTVLVSFGVCDKLGFWFYISMGLVFVFPLLPIIKNKLKY